MKGIGQRSQAHSENTGRPRLVRTVKADDRKVDVCFGPDLPGENLESNGIKTHPGEGWFACFRFYGPLQPCFDKTRVLPDLDKV